MRTPFAVCRVFLLVAAGSLLSAGCGIGSERKHPLELKVEALQREKAELAGRIEQCQIENRQLAGQIETLAALPSEERLNPYQLRSVRITRFTNFYDKDEDGKREKLIVYVQPMDKDGDVVKAAGTVSVQLWNLNNPNGQALLGQWQVTADELGRLWFTTLLSSYRLIFDAGVTAEALAEPLSVKITFTDYLTGKIFRDQHVIEPPID